MSATSHDAQEQERRLRAEKRRTKGFLDSYVGGRVCSAHGCATVLSRYNAGPGCWKHSDATPRR
jgi:hypothetical protein